MFTQVLSRFVAASRYENLSPEAVEGAKRGALDLIAVTLAGGAEDVGRIVKQRVREQAGAGRSTVITGGFTAGANLAAYANGAMAHALDYDDVIHIGSYWMGHPSVVIFPAALAVAEARGLSGRDLIHAYCVGLEAYAKIGLFCGDQAYKNGWHNTSFIGAMAAAAAVAKLYRLDEEQTRRSFGVAASLAGGLRQNFGTMTKPLHAGIAARAGIEAVELAAAGLTADENIFEARLGFRNVFSGRPDTPSDAIPLGDEVLSPETFAARLGAPWAMAEPGLSFKICPSCRATHFGMEAGLAYRNAYGRTADQVVEIECLVPAHMGSVVFYHDPAKGLEGKFSLEYVLARTLLDGVPKASDFTDERVNQPAVKALMQKLKWLPFEPAPGTFGAPEFTFHLRNGEKFALKVEHLTGEAENPVGDDILIEKFLDCATPALSQSASAELKDLILNLERVDDVSAVTALFVSGRA
jgi:2-methylcitrate dehydratase PrpD